MRMAIFGLTVSSSWGNGHATLWRGLISALGKCGWHVDFFERDAPYYAGARDLTELAGGSLVLYRDWDDVRGMAERAIWPTPTSPWSPPIAPMRIAATALSATARRCRCSTISTPR